MRLGADLFCGAAGGWSLGMAWAGVRTAYAVEIDDHRAAAYAANFGVTPAKDVRQVDGARDFKRHVWLMAGSPPCKGISEVNQKGKGVDDDGLFFEFIRVADEHRPDWLALENVSRLQTRGSDRVLGALEQAGYTPWPLVVGSCHAGGSDQRERVYIVAANAARRKGWLARQSWIAPRGAPPLGRLFQPGPGRGGPGLERLWANALSRHLQPYAGLPAGVAEAARHALGDAVNPTVPYLITRALLAWERGHRLKEAA